MHGMMLVPTQYIGLQEPCRRQQHQQKALQRRWPALVVPLAMVHHTAQTSQTGTMPKIRSLL